MVRPQKERGIKEPPRVQSFKPIGIPGAFIDRIDVTIDEFEAIRLADVEGLDHQEASERIGISRSTFSRLVERAHKKIAEALVNVKELFIEGGNVHFRKNLFRCGKCGNAISIDINRPRPQKCPECGNINVINMAQVYGHGACCRNRRRRGR
jgi:predicted DNA-binding protein (UPF0251 family)